MAQRLADFLSSYELDVATLRDLFDGLGEPVFGVEIPSDRAETLWRLARLHVNELGYWPVILGTPERVQGEVETVQWRFASNTLAEPPAEAILDTALAVPPEAWLREKAKELQGDFADTLADIKVQRHPVPPRRLSPIIDLCGHPVPTAVLGFVPTTEGWQAPAYLHYYAVNWDITPADHVRMLRHWHEEFGAEVVGMRADRIVELFVQRPVRDWVEAMAVAFEQYVYCYDRVDRAGGTVKQLAMELLGQQVWHFWWD